MCFFFFSSRRRHTRFDCDWSSDVCSSDLTGWQAGEAEARRLVEESGGAMGYGENFSIGVNLFYRLGDRAAELFGGLPDYGAFIEEAHPAKKRDAPSRTPLRPPARLAPRGGRQRPG